MNSALCTAAAVIVHLCASHGVDALIWKGSDEVVLNNINDLHAQYYNIFKHGNRNAASHLWSSFLLEKSHQMTHEKLTHMFSGFCAVSGSPVQPMDRTRYRVALDKVGGGGKKIGYTYHCCSPCICDSKDFIRIDTKNITMLGGETRQYHFQVVGNPCERPGELAKPFVDPFGRGQTTLNHEAPDVRCDQNGKLEDAHMSDNGHIIIGLYHEEDESLKSMDEASFKDMCEHRAAQGYNSGMGQIFRKVAEITPLKFA